MALDPVCKMILFEEKAPFKWEYNGVVYYFCGEGCMARFKKDPEKYIKGEGKDWIEG